MYPMYHFIFSVILSGFLWPILGCKLVFFWLGAFFVDVDHYWWYILKFKDLSLKKAYIYGKSVSGFSDAKLHIFHTIEFWILLGICGVFSEFAFIILLGVMAHMIIDLVDMISKKIYFSRIFSFLGWYYTN